MAKERASSNIESDELYKKDQRIQNISRMFINHNPNAPSAVRALMGKNRQKLVDFAQNESLCQLDAYILMNDLMLEEAIRYAALFEGFHLRIKELLDLARSIAEQHEYDFELLARNLQSSPQQTPNFIHEWGHKHLVKMDEYLSELFTPHGQDHQLIRNFLYELFITHYLETLWHRHFQKLGDIEAEEIDALYPGVAYYAEAAPDPIAKAWVKCVSNRKTLREIQLLDDGLSGHEDLPRDEAVKLLLEEAADLALHDGHEAMEMVISSSMTIRIYRPYTPATMAQDLCMVEIDMNYDRVPTCCRFRVRRQDGAILPENSQYSCPDFNPSFDAKALRNTIISRFHQLVSEDPAGNRLDEKLFNHLDQATTPEEEPVEVVASIREAVSQTEITEIPEADVTKTKALTWGQITGLLGDSKRVVRAVERILGPPIRKGGNHLIFHNKAIDKKHPLPNHSLEVHTMICVLKRLGLSPQVFKDAYYNRLKAEDCLKDL